MAFTAVTEIMLYCPKCQSKYPAGSRRFCDNDGARLAVAPVSGSTSAPKPKGGVFTSLLGRTAPTNQTDEKLASTPKFVPLNVPPKAETEFKIPTAAETFKTEETFELELELDEPEAEIEETPAADIPAAKPYARLVKPNEIASGTAETGDRRTNPAGRTALSWEQPEVLVGETVKGRYRVTKLLGQDDESISYLAEDKISPNKKVLVRVLMEEETNDDLSSEIFAEERVSLSHLVHPNIAKVVDSGELLEGNSFIVSEYVEGKTIRDMLSRTGQLNAMRTARIIRQASYALSEAHQNGILHRNLKPENIFLDVSEAGIEQVKLTNFSVYDKITDANLAYKSPEQIDGAFANYASDIYSLGVIAYQMLTNRLPFNASTVASLRKAQYEDLTLLPTNLRLDVPPLVDEILVKALSANPSDRYPKARDFGDAFFNALTTISPWDKSETEDEEQTADEEQTETAEKKEDKNYLVLTPIKAKTEEKTEEIIFEESEQIPKPQEELFTKDDAPEVAETEETETETSETLPWEKRSPDAVRETSPHWLMIGIFGLGLLVFLGVWYYFLNRPPASDFIPPVANIQPTENTATEDTTIVQTPTPNSEINEIPPPERTVEQKPNTFRFVNSKQGLEGDLAKNFLGFSVDYPNNWTKNASKTDFLDISKRSADNLPVKQVIITRYESKGTFNLDKPNFAKIVEKSNADLKKDLPNYRVVSQGETTIQNGRWKVYEVKFENSGKVASDGQLTLWGRRLWIPIQRPGMKSGFVITLVATSLAPNVKSVEDLITDEELAQILEDFEPSSSY